MVYVPKPGRGKPDPIEEAFVGLAPFVWRLCNQSEIHPYIDMYLYRESQKNALSEPRLLPVLLLPQLGKQLIDRLGDELLP